MKIPALSTSSFLLKNALPKMALSILLISLFFLIFTSLTNAQDYTETVVGDTVTRDTIGPAQDYETFEEENSSSFNNPYNTDSDVELNVHNSVQILMLEVLAAASCQITGVDPTGPNGKCLGVNTETGKVGFVENGGGAIAVVGSLIDATFTPPASSMQYVAYLKNNFGIVDSAHAQVPDPSPCLSSARGVGFCAIEPIIGLWAAMRNIVYLLFILVFIVIGMGIMLRLHIDPRTVMTIQNQIPKIIIGILAITFSFAIAGLLIDIMWIAIYLFVSTIHQATSSVGGLPLQSAIDITHSNSPFDAANRIYDGGIFDITGTAASAFTHIVVDGFDSILVPGNPLSGPIEFFVSIAAWLIIFFAILIALLRLLITLIITYINIVLDIVFAPFWILAGLLPGGPLGLGAWFRDLLANLAVFPVTIGFFILAAFFVNAFSGNEGFQNSNNLFIPPLMGGANTSAVSALIGLGFILMLPNILKTVKAVFKTPNLSLGPILSPVQSSASALGGTPRRLVSAGERSRYANQGEGFSDKVFRGFGNPIYSGGGHASKPTNRGG